MVYQRAHALPVFRGIRLQPQCLDTEVSQALAHYLQDENVYFQLEPPSVHRINAADRAIQTFKNHFIAIIYGTYPNINLALWGKN